MKKQNQHFRTLCVGEAFERKPFRFYDLMITFKIALVTSLFLVNGSQSGMAQSDILTIEKQKRLCREALNENLDGFRKDQTSQSAVIELRRREMTINYCRQRLGFNALSRLNTDKETCQGALNPSQQNFDDRAQFSQDVGEAKRRNLTVEACVALVQSRTLPPKKTVEKSQPPKIKTADNEAYRKNENQTLCRVSLNSEKDDWDHSNPEFKDYISEVLRRGYTVAWCRETLGLPRLEITTEKPIQPSFAQSSNSESDSQNALHQNLMLELSDFVKSGQPSTDHIIFSMAVSKFRSALNSNDNSLKQAEYERLKSILEKDTNYQKYRDQIVQKQKQAELEKKNERWNQIKLRTDFISDYLRRDPLNPNAHDLGELYIKLNEVFNSKDDTKISAIENEALALFNKLQLTPSFVKSIQVKRLEENAFVSAPNPVPQVLPSNAVPLKKVALVIGNSNYQFVPKLDNPSRDTELISKTLEEAGFETVIKKINLSREQMITAIQEFAIIADASDWSIIYFAGHGIELGGTNYVIPIDAKLKADRDIEIETINLAQISRSIESAKKLKMIILDACRDNPFASQMKRTIASRSIGRGLARVEPEAGTLVVYAAKNGEIAYDGEGENSPFAKALVKRIKQKPALEIRRLVDFVRDDVLEATSKKQQPFSYGSLPANEDYYFFN